MDRAWRNATPFLLLFYGRPYAGVFRARRMNPFSLVVVYLLIDAFKSLGRASERGSAVVHGRGYGISRRDHRIGVPDELHRRAVLRPGAVSGPYNRIVFITVRVIKRAVRIQSVCRMTDLLDAAARV